MREPQPAGAYNYGGRVGSKQEKEKRTRAASAKRDMAHVRLYAEKTPKKGPVIGHLIQRMSISNLCYSVERPVERQQATTTKVSLLFDFSVVTTTLQYALCIYVREYQINRCVCLCFFFDLLRNDC